MIWSHPQSFRVISDKIYFQIVFQAMSSVSIRLCNVHKLWVSRSIRKVVLLEKWGAFSVSIRKTCVFSLIEHVLLMLKRRDDYLRMNWPLCYQLTSIQFWRWCVLRIVIQLDECMPFKSLFDGFHCSVSSEKLFTKFCICIAFTSNLHRIVSFNWVSDFSAWTNKIKVKIEKKFLYSWLLSFDWIWTTSVLRGMDIQLMEKCWGYTLPSNPKEITNFSTRKKNAPRPTERKNK